MNEGLIPFDDARAQIVAAARPVHEVEEVETAAALGRVLAAPQKVSIDMPPMDNSSMDGYAVRTADVPQAGVVLPVSQRIPAGCPSEPLTPGTAARIFTGAMLPAGADAVMMQEVCTAMEGDHVRIDRIPRVGEAIRRKGENMAAGTEILPRGIRLRPQEVALAASAGLASLPVFRRLRVAVLSTGNELVELGAPLPPGAIYNSNRYLLRALLQQLGCEVSDFGIIPDRFDATRETLRRAAEAHDLVLSSGGVSVGEEDHVKPAVQAEGELSLWRVAMKPGKALAFGRVQQTPFIGLPGNSVSSFVTFLVMVRPFLLTMQGVENVLPRALMLPSDFDWAKPDSRREFLRARLDEDGALRLFSDQGSAALQSTAWAEGLIDNPAGAPIEKGQPVRFMPYETLLY